MALKNIIMNATPIMKSLINCREIGSNVLSNVLEIIPPNGATIIIKIKYGRVFLDIFK